MLVAVVGAALAVASIGAQHQEASNDYPNPYTIETWGHLPDGRVFGGIAGVDVDIDGKSVKSCTHLAVQCEGASVTTVEGLASKGVLHAVQEGFYKEHGLQCGFCTPGMLTRAYAFLQENPNPTEEEIRVGMSGNLCRCTGYQNIIKAVKAVRDGMAAAK